jgi:chaperone modulatory protein CbpM
MMGEQELVDSIDALNTDALRHWVGLGWVLPEGVENQPVYDLSDIARVHLICELHFDLRIEDSNMSVVLSLLDQLYVMRRSVRTLVSAIETQPDEVRDRIAALVASEV